MKIPPRNVFSSFHSQPTSSSFVNDKKPKKARIESETTKLVFTSFFKFQDFYTLANHTKILRIELSIENHT